MDIKNIWGIWRSAEANDKDITKSFERACTPSACHELLLEIEELKLERDAAVDRVEMCNLSDWNIYMTTDFGKKMLAIRDLEQQAKGIDDFANKYCGLCKTLEQAAVSASASNFCEKLKTQAKEIK